MSSARAGPWPRSSSGCRRSRRPAGAGARGRPSGLPAAGRLAGPEWYRVGRFLHRSIPDFYARHPIPALLDLYRAAGLRDLRLRRLSFGAGVVIWGVAQA